MKKLHWFLFAFLLITNSCIPSTELVDNQVNNSDFKYEYGSFTTRNFYGQVFDRNGNPVANATVTIGSSTVQTTSNGLFILKNAQVKEKFAYVKVTKSGFVNASRVLVPSSGNNRIKIMMIPATTTTTIVSGNTSTVSLTDGTKVKFDGSFKDANGNAYTGNVNVALFHLATTDTYFNETMPGTLLASDAEGNPRVLESYGMVHVQLTGSSGQNLQISTGHTAEITLPISATQSASAPASIPLWSFDESLGIWKLEGAAIKTGATYVGNVSHFSWWNCDYPYPLSTLNVTVNNTANQPISGIRVQISVTGQTYNHNTMTDNYGVATGLVPANTGLTLSIFDQCNNMIYAAPIGPFVTNSTNTVPVTLSNSVLQTFNITGILKDCSGNNVTDGMVQLTSANISNFYQNSFLLVNNGAFSFTTFACNSTQQFVLNGYDYTNMQTSGNIAFTATIPTTNVGSITTCNAVTEFITYQIDNQDPKICVGTFSVSSATSPNGTYTNINHSSTNIFGLNYPAVLTNGLSINSGYTLNLSGIPGATTAINVNGTTNNILFKVNSFGAIGTYVDFTLNGTFVDSTGSHTLTGTGHVLRDF